MFDLDKTAHHKVYKTELLGDTLVVTLQGDSPGFSVGAVQNEMATVVGLAKSPEVRHLIIDLSGSNYYGSLILGEIVNLGQAVKGKGGRVALAGVSDDMKEILRMMRLDAMWERYPYRSMALRALADIPWQVRIRPYLKPAAYVGGALLLLALFVFFPRTDPAQEYYTRMSKLWAEGLEHRRAQASDTEWLFFTKRAKEKMEEMTARLLKHQDNDLAIKLIYVTRDNAPEAFERHLSPTDVHTISAGYYLAFVKARLEKTELPLKPKELE